MVNVKIRTRYAPSPTGMFHIGGARTALFNYLFAKHFHGDFIVRIEDTDTLRNVEDGIQSQLENLKWLNIFADESPINPGSFGPYQQTEKLNAYKEVARRLVDEGKAYYCFCDVGVLENMRNDSLKAKHTPKYDRRCLQLSKEVIQEYIDNDKPYSIRIKIPDHQQFAWDDLVRGKISIPSSSMNDIIIVKTNGMPTYNFAVVVDDLHMEITHVIRGEEHITNTAYQLHISKCINPNANIKYGHLSIIVDENGKKLSKRSGNADCFIESYRNIGYLPEAIDNFLLLLGWSFPGGQEFFTINEAIEIFDINTVSGAPSIFDVEKLRWINREYIKKMDDIAYVAFVETFLKPKLLDHLDKKDQVLLLFKNQLSCASEINSLILEFFPSYINPRDVVESIQKENFSIISVRNLFETFIANLTALSEWNLSDIAACFKTTQKQTHLSGKNLFQPIRLALTGKDHGPQINGLVYVLGQKKCLDSINAVLNMLGSI